MAKFTSVKAIVQKEWKIAAIAGFAAVLMACGGPATGTPDGNETAAKVNGKVIISGVGGSYGCFVLKVTP